MADKAHILTDKELEEMERHLSVIYARAEKELAEKAEKYFKRFEDLDAKKRELVEAGKLTEQEYKRWRQNKIMTGKHWTAMKEQAAQELLQANRTAQEYINGRLPSVYATNYNLTSEGVSAAVNGYSFELVDASTVKNLATSDKTLLPYKYVDGRKDVRWNTAKVNSEVLQGIVQGESIPNIAKRLRNVTEMNRVSAIRNARTTVTSAENKGRMDSLHRAAEKGVITRKIWMAAIDARTREAHRLLDGQEQDIDDPFESEYGKIMYPGDPDADPANVYNCRCTLTYKVVGFGKRENDAVAETIDEAIEQANNLGVKYAQFGKMSLEQANNAVSAVKTLPEDCRPKVIANGKDVSLVTGRPLGRKADQWWGVTYDYRPFSLRTMQLGYNSTDLDGGLIVGLNTQKYKTLDALAAAKKQNNERYFAKTGRYWSFNTSGESTAFHEIGHCFADVRGLPDGWDAISARWAQESKCDLLLKPDEAFAEAWAAYYTGNKELPDYIFNIIKGLK